MPRLFELLAAPLQWLAIALLVALAALGNSPTFAGIRPVAVPLVLLCGLALAIRPSLQLRRSPQASAALQVTAIAIAGALAAERMVCLRLRMARALDAPAEIRAEVGRHLLVGFRTWEEARDFVERGEVGGLFVTARNVLGLSAGELAERIADLQRLRAQRGGAALFIAADHEGGRVSRLSPPLTALPALAQVVSGARSGAELDSRVAAYARIHGSELSAVGVNLDLAPVADLSGGDGGVLDFYSRIQTRAVATDPRVVARATSMYAWTLQGFGVLATAKHFPGLGKVRADTHFFSASLPVAVEELEDADWLPFRALAPMVGAIMLGHVRMPEIDGEWPASLSPAIATGLLRDRWGYQGLLLTDDLCMGPIARGRGGIGGGAVQALSAGVDLALVTYDPEQVWGALEALVEARREGRLDPESLERSRARLDAALQRAASSIGGQRSHAGI